jgi:predicted acylesterase/phospholipase RssA
MSLSRSGFLAALGVLGAVGAAATPASAALPPWFPLPPPLRPKAPKRALVLSGAGARGAYEAGALKWLFKDIDANGPPFDLVCGTSAGAINAAFAARASSASIAEVGQMWLSMPQAEVLQLVPPAQHAVNAGQALQESSEHGYPRKFHYLSKANRELKAMGSKEELGKLLGVVSSDGIDGLVRKYPMTLAVMKTSLVVTATNMTRFSSDTFYHFTGPGGDRQKEHFLQRLALPSVSGGPPLQASAQRFALTDDNLVKAVLASAAVPGVFQPVEVLISETGVADTFVDGGVANNTPISTAVSAGASDITVLIASAASEGMEKPPNTLPGLLQGSFSVIQRELFEDDIRLALARNVLSRIRNYSGLSAASAAFLRAIHAREWEPITLRIIRPPQPLKLTSMGFNDGPDLQSAFDEGYADAQSPVVYSV